MPSKRNAKRPIKGSREKLDPRAKSVVIGDKERKLRRDQEILKKREAGLTSTQIAHDLSISPATVSQILKRQRNNLARKNVEATDRLRNEAAARLRALLDRWLPIALNPIRIARTQRMGANGLEVVETQVFNEPAVAAANIVLKAQAQLSKLFALNLEPADDKGIDKENFMLWINNVVNTGHDKGIEAEGKTGYAVMRMGKLVIGPEPEDLISPKTTSILSKWEKAC